MLVSDDGEQKIYGKTGSGFDGKAGLLDFQRKAMRTSTLQYI